jgi:hypothetical protein
MEGSRSSCSSPRERGYQHCSKAQLPTQRRTPTVEHPMEDPVEYIPTGLFHTHARAHDRTHRTISMTGCQGGALLRSTAPNARRPHPTLAARRWRARVRLRGTSPSPTPTHVRCYPIVVPPIGWTRRTHVFWGCAPLRGAWDSLRRRSGSSALAKGEVPRRRSMC